MRCGADAGKRGAGAKLSQRAPPRQAARDACIRPKTAICLPSLAHTARFPGPRASGHRSSVVTTRPRTLGGGSESLHARAASTNPPLPSHKVFLDLYSVCCSRPIHQILRRSQSSWHATVCVPHICGVLGRRPEPQGQDGCIRQQAAATAQGNFVPLQRWHGRSSGPAATKATERRETR